MLSRRLTITVPQPCQENWDEMTPVHQGRFCQSCAKTVVDFTAMSDAEVVDWLAKQKRATCGKFTVSQLSSTFVAPSILSRTLTSRAFLLGLMVWLGLKPADAQDITHKENLEVPLLSPSSASVFPLRPAQNSSAISGTVVAISNGKMADVIIRLNDSIEVKTNATGCFSILPNQHVSLEKQWLVISALGFLTQRHRLSDVKESRTINIALVPKDFSSVLSGKIGGVVVLYKWHTLRGMLQRVKKIFK